MKRYKCAFLLLLCLSLCGSAWCADRSSSYKPKWVTHKLPQSSPDRHYTFISAFGNGESLDEARHKALADLTRRIETKHGVRVNNNTIPKEYSFSGTNEFSMEIADKGQKLDIVCRVIDEYWERDYRGYTIYVLYTVANKSGYGNSYDDKISVTAQYGAAGLLSVVPGMGQFYKGATTKGALFLGGTAALAGGVVYCQSSIINSRSLAAATHNVEHKKVYARRIAGMTTARNVCMGAAAALYVWNIVDAVVTPGARRVVVKPTVNYGGYAMEGWGTSANSFGVSATYTF